MTDFIGPDGQPRCKWSGAAPEFLDYHDREWGFPVSNDIRLFEKLCLESFQSGLSWRTILNKRAGFRAAFDGFDFFKIARYGESDIERLLSDESIVARSPQSSTTRLARWRWSRRKVCWHPFFGVSSPKMKNSGCLNRNLPARVQKPSHEN